MNEIKCWVGHQVKWKNSPWSWGFGSNVYPSQTRAINSEDPHAQFTYPKAVENCKGRLIWLLPWQNCKYEKAVHIRTHFKDSAHAQNRILAGATTAKFSKERQHCWFFLGVETGNIWSNPCALIVFCY